MPLQVDNYPIYYIHGHGCNHNLLCTEYDYWDVLESSRGLGPFNLDPSRVGLALSPFTNPSCILDIIPDFGEISHSIRLYDNYTPAQLWDLQLHYLNWSEANPTRDRLMDTDSYYYKTLYGCVSSLISHVDWCDAVLKTLNSPSR